MRRGRRWCCGSGAPSVTYLDPWLSSLRGGRARHGHASAVRWWSSFPPPSPGLWPRAVGIGHARARPHTCTAGRAISRRPQAPTPHLLASGHMVVFSDHSRRAGDCLRGSFCRPPAVCSRPFWEGVEQGPLSADALPTAVESRPSVGDVTAGVGWYPSGGAQRVSSVADGAAVPHGLCRCVVCSTPLCTAATLHFAQA